MNCEDLIKRCKGNCNKLYEMVKRSCRKVLRRRSGCFQPCTTAIMKLLKNEIGNLIWHCRNPQGKLKKLRKACHKKL